MTYDLLIVGGGVVGATLAVSLSSLNLKVGIIDSQNLIETKPDGRTIALSYGSTKIFEALGVWSEIKAYTTPVNQVHVSEKGKFGTTTITHDLNDVPALGYVLPMQQLHSTLFSVLKSKEIDLISETKVVGFESHDEGVTLSVEKYGQKNALTAKWVIAADGAFSFVREAAGIEITTKDYESFALVCQIELKRPHNQTAYERFSSEGTMALLPLSANRGAFVWTLSQEDKETMLALDDDVFLDTVQEKFGYRAGRFLSVTKRITFPLKLIQAKTLVKNRVILAGNAAHLLNPVSAQGLNLGLRDVEVLADLLAENFPKNMSKAIETYEEVRLKDHKRTIRITDGLVTLFSTKHMPYTPLRNIGLAAMPHVPGAVKQFSKVMMGVV